MPLPKNPNRRDSDREACNRYNARNAAVSTKVPKELAEQFRQYCADNNTTPNAVLREYVEFLLSDA